MRNLTEFNSEGSCQLLKYHSSVELRQAQSMSLLAQSKTVRKGNILNSTQNKVGAKCLIPKIVMNTYIIAAETENNFSRNENWN